jgi:hypothetical protein
MSFILVRTSPSKLTRGKVSSHAPSPNLKQILNHLPTTFQPPSSRQSNPHFSESAATA